MPKAIERIRAALTALSDYNHDTTGKYRVAFNRACSPAAIAEVIDHIDAQDQEIERLRADAVRWQMLAHMEASKADPETLRFYIVNPKKLDFLAELNNRANGD